MTVSANNSSCLELRDYFRTSDNLGKLCALIDSENNEEIANVSADNRSELPAFFEELARYRKFRHAARGPSALFFRVLRDQMLGERCFLAKLARGR